MLNSKFEEIDRILLSFIMIGSNTLPKLMSNDGYLRKLVKSSLHDNAWQGLGSISLAISKRLQALRHRGVIAWNGYAWQIAEQLAESA